MREAEYVYRLPTRVSTAAVVFAALPGIVAHVWLLFKMPTNFLVWVMLLLVLLTAALTRRILRRPILRIDSRRIRWVFRRTEFWWKDAARAEVVSRLGVEYARIQTKEGKIRRIGLQRFGGAEYRKLVLGHLALAMRSKTGTQNGDSDRRRLRA